jgi:hypothetical protein
MQNGTTNQAKRSPLSCKMDYIYPSVLAVLCIILFSVRSHYVPEHGHDHSEHVHVHHH